MQHHRGRGRLAGRLLAALALTAGAAALPASAGATTLAPTCSLAGNVRTCELWAEQGDVSLPAVARLDSGSAAAGTQLVFSAIDPGPEGNAITVAFDGSNAGSPGIAPSVAVSGTDVVVTLGTDPTAGALDTTAADVESLVNGDPAASALVRALVPSGTGGGVLAAMPATHLAGGTRQAHVWTFTSSAGAATSLGGPTLVANAGETLDIVVHDALGAPSASEQAHDHDLALSVPQQALLPASSKIAPGGTATYEIKGLQAGTSLYEAGASAGSAAADDDVEQQVAMGLYGALVVLPATAGQAYDSADSAYDTEQVLVLSELDLSLANSNDPAGFDMTGYHPSYWLINGHTYDGADTDTIPPIEASPGNRVLLRYVNAGILDHSMGILRAHQRIVGYAGVQQKHPYDAVAEDVNPGETMDAVVSVPNTGDDGAKYVIAEQGEHLDVGGAGWADASGAPVTAGGMMTFINAAGLPAACYGATTSRVVVGTPSGKGIVAGSDVTNRQNGLPLSASFATCDPAATISKAELFVDGDTGDGTGYALPAGSIVDDGMAGGVHHYHLAAGTTVPAAQFAAPLGTGMHVLLLHAADTQGGVDTWGTDSGDAFTIDADAPKITGVSTNVDVKNGNLTLYFTADDSTTGGSDVDVSSAAAYIDDPTHPLSVAPEVADASGPIVGFMGTASLAGLSTGGHTIHITAGDLAGCPGTGCGNAATATTQVSFSIDTAGPSNAGFSIAPNPNNGTLDQPGQPGNVFLDGTFDDTLSGGSAIAGGEAFIDDTTMANGTGFVFLPEDGAWSSPVEKVHMPIPLTEIASLPEGLHKIWVHGKDAAGNWGGRTSIDLVIDRTRPTTALAALTPTPGADVTLRGAVTDPVSNGVSGGIDHLEWFIGADPGVGAARTTGVTDNHDGTFSILVPLPMLQTGQTNTVNVRVLDKAGNWSTLQAVTFAVPNPPTTPVFADAFDAGLGAWTVTGGTRIGTSVAARSGTTGTGVFVTLPGAAYLTRPVSPALAAYSATFQVNTNRARFGNAATVFQGRNGTTGLFRVQLRQAGRANNPVYSLQASYRNNARRAAWVALGGWATLPAGWHTVSISWVGGASGKLVLKLDTTLLVNQAVSATTLTLNSVQLGLIDGLPANATGTVYLDQFSSTTP